MGSISAMSSMDRVLKAHRDELGKEREGHLPQSVKDAGGKIELENNCYSISVLLVMPDGTVSLEPYDIDDMAERFPDCEVGY